MIDALLWVLWYNGHDEKIMQIYNYLKENADKSQVPYPEWLSDDADAPDRILWSVLVMLDGDYGVSPRYGWIEKPKSAIERMAWFVADVKEGGDQAAIEAVRKVKNDSDMPHYWNRGMEMAMEIIEDAASLPSADCDTCIYNVCNYNKVPWESNGELIDRQVAIDAVLKHFVPQTHTGERGEYEESYVRTIFNNIPSADREDYEKGYKDGQLAVMTGNDEKEFERGYRMGQAADRPTGEWEETGEWVETESDEPCWYRCSECARRTDEASDYCPNCGARMKGGRG